MTETFYGGFYGFQSAPFHITPDPSLLFPTETHRAALGAIEYGIAAGKGFIVVTGEVGVGKTTVLRVCLDGLDARRTKIIYLFSPALSTAELYATILDEFDVTMPPTSNAADILRVLQRTLLAVHESGTQVVLAVDEAQHMPEATLESLRILSNLETHKSKLLQIILVGQPELEAVLAKHSLRQLAQRVAVRARVRPLTFRQSCRYILHRTRCAGRATSRPLFTTPALLYLAVVARGIPRTINICCDNALINGYGHAAERITLGIVRESCRAMKFRSPLRRAAAAAMVAMVLVGLLVSAQTFLRYIRSAHAAPNPAMTTRSASQQAGASPAAIPARDQNRMVAIAATSGAPIEPATQKSPVTAVSSEARSASAAGTMPQAASEAPAALREGPGTASADPLPWIGSGDKTIDGSAPRREASIPPKASRWVVRQGDTLFKACRITYGWCDDKALRKVIAKNPGIGPDAKIYEGQIILMPRQSVAETRN